MEKYPQVIVAGVIIGIHDVGQADAGLVDQRLVLQRIGDQDHSLGEVALVEDRAVPGEDHGAVLYFALLHAVREALQDPVVQPRLFLAVPELAGIQRIIVQRALILDAVDRLVLLVADAVPDDRVDGIQVSGHESGRHLRIVRIGLQDLPRCLPAVFRELHIVVVIGNGQSLVLRAALHDLQHARDGVPRLVEADGPQTRDDLHAVVGLRHLQSPAPVADRFADVSKELRRDPVHRVEIADAGPGGDRSLDCREP